MNSRRAAIFALLGMASSFGLAEWARPTIKVSDGRPQIDLEALIPSSFASWSLDRAVPIVVPPPDQQAMLDKIYNQTLARTYVNSKSQRVMLSVAYGGDQSDGLSVHIPEVCYVSQGFRLESSLDAHMSLGGITIPVRRLVTTLGPRIEPITYWVLMGDEATISTTRRRLVSLRYGLQRRIPEGMLMRVSSIDANTANAYEIQATFLADLVAAIPAKDRDRIVGTVTAAEGRVL